MIAQYFASRSKKELIISRSPSLTIGNVIATYEVSGKAEARKIAARHNATCWNF